MLCPRRGPVTASVLSLALLLASCTGDDVLQPDATIPTPPAPSFELVDGSTGGNPGFYFLPPLVDNPGITGTFNPDLLPSVDVCLLDTSDSACDPSQPAGLPSWPSGSIVAADGKYAVNWDTDDPEWTALDQNRNYRIHVRVAGVELGHMDVNPQNPSGSTPGEDYPGMYAFRNGETLPIKFWIGVGALCESSDPAVIECAEASIVDETGGTLKLTNEGDILAVTFVPNSLPGGDPITVIVERIDESALGEPCLPGLDAPQYGPCFRIRALGLDGPLLTPAVVSICADPSTFGLPPGQDDVQIHRYDDENIYGLANTSTADCTTQVGLLKVPDRGLMRYAALGVNALARLVGPQPLAAAHLGLGGLTSSFSRFKWALPGEMTVTEGDGVVLQASDSKTIPATVQVLDGEDQPVEGATVHFATTSGTVDASAVTGGDGLATATWDLTGQPAGAHTLTASASGLWVDLPDHTTGFLVDLEQLTLTATIVGPPAAVTSSPTETVSGAAGETVGEPLSIFVTDAGGNPVSGAGVTWTASGDGSVVGDAATDAGGTATGTWTLPTTAGSASATATVGGLSATFDANVAPGAAANLAVNPDPVPDGYVGSTVALGVTVTDAYGNVRAGDGVTWTVTGGGGSVSGGATTDATGSASATWTSGATPGVNSVLVNAGGLTHTFTANGICRDGWGTANVDGTMDGAEWACARTADFTANLSGGSTPARVYWMNDGTRLYLAVRIRQSSLDKVNNVRFDFDNDVDGVAEAGDDIIGYDADAHSFFDQYLTAKCANNSQSGCGATDTVSRDGAGAVGNDGTYTFYELRHPLAGTPGEDFVRSVGQQLGFFLTLRIGNGAQGNTQWPGFRSYRNITVVGY